MTVDLSRALIGAVIGMIVFSILSRATFGKPQRHRIPQIEGRLTISRLYVACSALLMAGLGVILLGPWIITTSVIPSVLGLSCFVLALVSLAGMLPLFVVRWDQSGITAPAVLFGLPVPGKRRFFAWGDLVTARSDLFGNQCVADVNGRTLRWNFSYLGHRALMRAVAWYRPDLF
jgi:hypothetical protein